MSLGKNLQHARKNAHLTQEDVSKKLFVTRQTVSRWEQNKTLPNIYVLEALSELYGVSIKAFYLNKQDSDITEEEANNVKHLNIWALIGSIAFNVLLFSGVAITVVLLVFSLWILIGTFIAAPFILFIANMSGVQRFDWLNTVIALILFPIGVINFQLAKRISVNTIDMFKKYYRYNMKLIFAEKNQEI